MEYLEQEALRVIRPVIIFACIVSSLGSPLLAGDPITIDGFFEDWASVPVAYSDAEEGAQEDFAELKITNDDTFLFFKLTFHSAEFRLRRDNAITLYIDTDQNVETGLAIQGIGAELEWCFGCGEGTFYDGQGTTPLERSDLTLFMAPAFTSQTFEIALSRSSAPLTLHETQIPAMLSLALVASSQEDFLPDEPGTLGYLIDPTPVDLPAPISLSRTGEEHLRIITYNTLFSGPLDPSRQPAFERIIRALDPDIIAFQEMGSASQVEPLIADWLETSPLWSVSVGNGNSVVSKYPILDSAELISARRISAILVDTQAVLGTRLLLLNTHLIPFDDAMSQEDADELIMQLRTWRSGEGPFELASDTPIVHVGDFNLAGSSRLLKTLRDGDISDESRFGSDFLPDWDGTAITDLNSRQTGLRAGFTTSRGGASKLDYVFYTDSVIELGNHYVLNTTTLSQTELAVGGLEAEDTDLASDHLPRVVDIAAIVESGANEELYFAQFADGAGLFSQIILFNLDPDLEADVTLVLRDNEGNPLTVDLNGEQVSGQATTIIPTGGLRRFRTDGLGDLVTGSVRVISDQPVAGVILFGGTDGLAGVGSSTTLPIGFVVPIETNSGSEIDTAIAVVNLEESSVDLTLELVDGDGAVLASAQAVLSGLGHLATFLPDFSWSSTVDFSDFEGTVKVSATGPVAATVIQTRPGQLATLPVVPLLVEPAEGSIELNFAQFADGAGLFSQTTIFNPDPDLEANVTLVLKDDEGNPFTVDLNGEQVSGEVTALIPAGGLRRFETDGLGDLATGWVRVTSDRPVAGVVLFGGADGLAGVDSSATQPTGFVAPVEISDGSDINTGIAVVNLEESSVDLTLQLADGDGAVFASAQAFLSGLGHLATFLPDFSWSSAVDFSDFEGTVKVSTTGPVAGTVIQTRPGQLATLPVVPLSSPPETASELVLINGTILTMDPDDSMASAVKIQDGRIVAVGDDIGAISPSATVIDLGGRTVTPGLIDTHAHYFRDSHIPGYHFSAIELVFTIPDLLDALTERAASVPAGEFITVLGRFVAAQFAENRLPTLAELDGAAPDHPVYLHSGFSGPAVTNTLGKAFFEAGGVAVNPSGAFNMGQTGPPVQALFADYSNEEALRTVREYMQFSASLGLTTIQNFSGCGGSFGGQLPAGVLCEENFFDLWQQGALGVRIRTSAGGFGTSPDQNGIYSVVLSTQEHLQELQDLGGGDDMLRFGATGEFVVGNFGSTSAPFAEAYLQIAEQGWSLRQHSISSGENEAHISAFESVNATIPIADLRWAVEHIFTISTDRINRLKEIGAGATVQNQQYLLGGSGPPYRDLVDAGIPVGGGTDASAISPLSPWISLYHMVTGKNAAGSVTNAGQQISRMEALRLYTTGSAYFTFDDTNLGSIEVGKLADLAVISDDYLSVAEEEIRTLSSVLTLIGGEIVHAAAEFSDLDP